jgi:hypothetical protein
MRDVSDKRCFRKDMFKNNSETTRFTFTNLVHNSYCSYAPMLYTAPRPVCIVLDACGSINEGKWEGVGPWKPRLFWAL